MQSKRVPKSLEIFEGDLDYDTTSELMCSEVLQIDTETDGLDFRQHPLRAVTICTTSNHVCIIKNPERPQLGGFYLDEVLCGTTEKIFHHAYFDLCYLMAWLDIHPRGIIHCTKIMMKVLYPEKLCGLGSSLKAILGVKINKKIQHGQWKNEKWSARQKQYMANDTIYLHALAKELMGRMNGAQARAYYVGTQAVVHKVEADVMGYTDLTQYESAPAQESIANRVWWTKQKKEIYNEM